MTLNAYPILLEAGKKLVVADEHQDHKPQFFMLATSAIKLLPLLDGNAAWLFWKLVETRSLTTNIAVIPRVALTVGEYRRANRGYFELKRLNVCKRIKRETYQLNPDVVLPINGYWQVRTEYQGNPEKG